MVSVQMVRMAVTQVVDVAVVLHHNVAAGRRVPVIVIGMRRVGGHTITRSPLPAGSSTGRRPSPAGTLRIKGRRCWLNRAEELRASN